MRIQHSPFLFGAICTYFVLISHASADKCRFVSTSVSGQDVSVTYPIDYLRVCWASGHGEHRRFHEFSQSPVRIGVDGTALVTGPDGQLNAFDFKNGATYYIFFCSETDLKRRLNNRETLDSLGAPTRVYLKDGWNSDKVSVVKNGSAFSVRLNSTHVASITRDSVFSLRTANTPSEQLNLAIPFARLAKHVYREGDSAEEGVPAGFEIVSPRLVQSESTGFLAKSYRNTETGELIVAFAGTDPKSLNDLKADVSLALGVNTNPQFKQADEVFNTVKRDYPGQRVIATGHSLGGALANYAALMHEAHAVVFNSPGINDSFYRRVPDRNKQTRVRGPWYLSFQSTGESGAWYRWDKDRITNAVTARHAVIETISLPTGCHLDAICHSIDHFDKKILEFGQHASAYIVEPVIKAGGDVHAFVSPKMAFTVESDLAKSSFESTADDRGRLLLGRLTKPGFYSIRIKNQTHNVQFALAVSADGESHFRIDSEAVRLRNVDVGSKLSSPTVDKIFGNASRERLAKALRAATVTWLGENIASIGTTTVTCTLCFSPGGQAACPICVESGVANVVDLTMEVFVELVRILKEDGVLEPDEADAVIAVVKRADGALSVVLAPGRIDKLLETVSYVVETTVETKGVTVVAKSGKDSINRYRMLIELRKQL